MRRACSNPFKRCAGGARRARTAIARARGAAAGDGRQPSKTERAAAECFPRACSQLRQLAVPRSSTPPAGRRRRRVPARTAPRRALVRGALLRRRNARGLGSALQVRCGHLPPRARAPHTPASAMPAPGCARWGAIAQDALRRTRAAVRARPDGRVSSTTLLYLLRCFVFTCLCSQPATASRLFVYLTASQNRQLDGLQSS